MDKFTRVNLDDELRADSDGMPVFRKCFEHEILLSFYDDVGAYAFREWWDDVGSKQMFEWMKGHDEHSGQCEWQTDK